MNGQDKRYLLEFDRIHKLSEYTIALYSNSENKKKEIKDDFLDFLIFAYSFGTAEAYKLLGVEKKEPKKDKMYDAIYKNIAGKNFEQRVDDEIDHDGELMRLIDSEFHRVYNTALFDTADDINNDPQSGKAGLIMKTWITMGDDRVRDTHDYLEGTTVSLNERFYTYDGDSALFPGGFTTAQENANCRCGISLSTL